MKIGPAPQTPLRLFADSRSPTSSFVDMVSDPRVNGGNDGPLQSAFGFQALGMFGRQEAVGGSERRAPSPPRPHAPDTALPRQPSTTDRPDPGAVSVAERTVAMTQGPSGKSIHARSIHATGPARTGTVATDGISAMEAPASNVEDETPTPRLAMPPGLRRKPDRPVAHMRLALFNTESGVAVTVTAPRLSACDSQRFRERAEAVLRERSIVLDKVAVNGEGRVRFDASRGSS